VADDEADDRRALRDSAAPNPRPGRQLRYSGAQALYALEAKPRTAATAIVDNTDADHPRRRFADSC